MDHHIRLLAFGTLLQFDGNRVRRMLRTSWVVVQASFPLSGSSEVLVSVWGSSSEISKILKVRGRTVYINGVEPTGIWHWTIRRISLRAQSIALGCVVSSMLVLQPRGLSWGSNGGRFRGRGARTTPRGYRIEGGEKIRLLGLLWLAFGRGVHSLLSRHALYRGGFEKAFRKMAGHVTHVSGVLSQRFKIASQFDDFTAETGRNKGKRSASQLLIRRSSRQEGVF